jgi:transcriptional pleiotropic regulator of transition state genes
MKSIGCIRKVHELVRIVIPVELRKSMSIEIKDPMEIYVDGEQIILKKYEAACAFCGNERDVENY